MSENSRWSSIKYLERIWRDQFELAVYLQPKSTYFSKKSNKMTVYTLIESVGSPPPELLALVLRSIAKLSISSIMTQTKLHSPSAAFSLMTSNSFWIDFPDSENHREKSWLV